MKNNMKPLTYRRIKDGPCRILDFEVEMVESMKNESHVEEGQPISEINVVWHEKITQQMGLD